MSGSALYFGQVMHRRRTPRAYRFAYRLFSLLLDIDELDKLDGRLRFFSRNRFNLVSFYDRDHGPRDGSDLRQWANELLRKQHLAPVDGPIRLLSFPRVLGIGFSPLSVWYCHDSEQALRAIILEVRNTFGEKHQYLIPIHDPAQVNWPACWSVDKAFHVSPFIGPRARYQFQFQNPGSRFLVRIQEYWRNDDKATSDNKAPDMLATWSGQRQVLSDWRLLSLACRIPLLGIKIITLIHWHGLKLWLRGLPFYTKPKPPNTEVSTACPHNTPPKR